MPSAIKLVNVSCRLGDKTAVDGISLAIAEDEVFALLGPSGSGKTTLLRLIAGFERPSSGEIRILGETMFGMPPYRRPVNTVFQENTLFQHLSVVQNVAYGLMIAGEGKARRLRLADEMLDKLQIRQCGDLRPDELSDEQVRRVMLARALIMKPRVLLLDEPMSGLDLRKRQNLLDELKVLQAELGIAFLFVTHDHAEAFSIADRVAALNKGRIEQVASPQEMYHRPQTPFVADFVGFSNVFSPEITHLLTGHEVYSCLRPEAIRITNRGKPAIVISSSFLGTSTRLILEMAGAQATAIIPHGTKVPEPGQKINVVWNDADLHLMDKQ